MARHACEPEVSLEDQFDGFMSCWSLSPEVDVRGLRAEIGVNALVMRARSKYAAGLPWLKEFNNSSGKVRPIFMLQRELGSSCGVNMILVENIGQTLSEEFKLAYLSAPKDNYPALQAGVKGAKRVQHITSPQQLVNEAPEDLVAFFLGVSFTQWLISNKDRLLNDNTLKSWSLSNAKARCNNIFADIIVKPSLERTVVIETVSSEFGWSAEEIISNRDFTLPDNMRAVMETLANG
jgi:hypothetical protein